MRYKVEIDKGSSIGRINVLMILISIILITIPILSIIGKLFFWFTLLINFLYYLKFRCWKWYINLDNISLIIILLTWMFIRAQNLYGLKNFLLFAILMGIYVTNIPYSNISKRGILLFVSYSIIMALFLRVTGSFYTNTNIGGAITAIIMLLAYVYYPKHHCWIVLIGIPTIMMYDSRSVLLAIIISFVIVHLVKNEYIKLKTILLGLLIVIGGGMYLLWDILMSPEFNTFVFETTNKNFQSGRNLIWGAIFDYMRGIDWIIGVGGGVQHGLIVPEHFKNMSLHSSYVFMIFHYGLIGLSLLILLFYKVLNGLIKNKYYYSAILFLFFILRDFFEITLVNNQMAIAILFWGWIANGWIERAKERNNIIKEKNIIYEYN